MPILVCPYCVTRQEFSVSNITCDQCGESVPKSFIEAAMVRDPIWLVTIGSRQVGKTTFIDSMVSTMKAMVKVSNPRIRLKMLDTHTMKTMQEIQKRTLEGKIQPPTKKEQKFRPLLFDVTNIAGYDNNPIVLYDYAGEIFDENPDDVAQYAPALREANTVWLFISISDVRENTTGQSIEWALEYYIRGMEQLDAPLIGRDLLVIFTKADRLGDEIDDTILDYLLDDDYKQLAKMSLEDTEKYPFDLDSYFKKMESISKQLEDYLYQNDGYEIIELAAEHNMNLKLAINSAIGADTVGHITTHANPDRMRVIDPLLYALKGVATKHEQREVVLIIDSSSEGIREFLSTNLHSQAFDALKPRNVATTTYYIGNKTPEFTAGQRPEGEPLPTNKVPLSLIGPILDGLSEDARVIVFTCHDLMDLSDFRYSSWDQRLFLITTRELPTEWSHVLIYVPNAHSIDAIIEEFFRLMPNR